MSHDLLTTLGTTGTPCKISIQPNIEFKVEEGFATCVIGCRDYYFNNEILMHDHVEQSKLIQYFDLVPMILVSQYLLTSSIYC